MKMVKLSDFYPYDRNKGGIQELHHKIESKTLQYWGEDSGILIGITPIYKRRLWSEEVKADPEDNYEWTNKDGNEKYSTKNIPKAHFRWDWRRYTLSKKSVDKITEFVDTILKS